MTYDELREGVKCALYDMHDRDIINAWNELCDNENYMDDYIYSNDPDELLYGQTPSEVLNNIGSDYNINDEYAVFTIYGLESFDYVTDSNCPVDYDMLVDYVIDNSEAFDNSEIEDLLEEYDSEDEEEDEEK